MDEFDIELRLSGMKITHLIVYTNPLGFTHTVPCYGQASLRAMLKWILDYPSLMLVKVDNVEDV